MGASASRAAWTADENWIVPASTCRCGEQEADDAREVG